VSEGPMQIRPQLVEISAETVLQLLEQSLGELRTQRHRIELETEIAKSTAYGSAAEFAAADPEGFAEFSAGRVNIDPLAPSVSVTAEVAGKPLAVVQAAEAQLATAILLIQQGTKLAVSSLVSIALV